MTSLRTRLASLFAPNRELVGINRRNVEFVYRHNRRENYVYADDKLETKELLRAAGVNVPETLATCDGVGKVPETLRVVSGLEHFVLKPASGSGGNGILVVGERVDDSTWRSPGGRQVSLAELRMHLAEIVFGAFSNELEDRAIIERRIIPHPFFSELWSDGLCDIRVITLSARPVIAMLRVPTRRSQGRANLHQGGIGIAVALEDGRLVAALSAGRRVTRHPESGADLLGRVVPHWDSVLDNARRAAAAVPLGYLGVDLVVDRGVGPLVLEVNARPGLEIQNVHGRGLRGFVEQVMQEDS